MNTIIPTEEELRKRLTPEQYHVLKEKGTEAPFSGKYVHEENDGTYTCVVCGSPLFLSDTKFDSGSGWPSFDEAIPGSVNLVRDLSSGSVQDMNLLIQERTEVTCAHCGSHLGHLFDDGPTKTGKRYCMNSVCLDLQTKE